MGRRFFWSMVLVAVVTLSLGGVAGAILINRSVERSVRTEFARQASATARIIEQQFIITTVNDRPTVRDAPPGGRSLGETLLLVSAIGGHDYVEAVFVGPRGEVSVLGDTEPVLLDQIPDIGDLQRSFAFDAELESGQVAAVAQPFEVGQRGKLIVVIGTNLEIIPWGEVLVRFAWAIALGIVLAALLAGATARRLARRLDPLEEASRGIADGDFGTRIDVGGSDELSDLARAFNEMAVQLEAARTREREFLASVSHDLRTPLTTIAGYAEAMQEGRVSADDLDRVAAVLGTESGRLRRLVEDLMLLSRIEAREFSLRPESVDLAAHLKGVLDGFRQRADAAKVVLDGDLDPVGLVAIDPDRVAQVVGNLLENALRYTPEAGTVTLALTAIDGIEITVSDTGPGIDATDLPHIWERLYVTARYRPVRPEGSGLGLSIVRELVDVMGGSATVDSAPGRGTSISVRLPAGDVPSV
jgi:two-component system sensor histidine kinase BaeS